LADGTNARPVFYSWGTNRKQKAIWCEL